MRFSSATYGKCDPKHYLREEAVHRRWRRLQKKEEKCSLDVGIGIGIGIDIGIGIGIGMPVKN